MSPNALSMPSQRTIRTLLLPVLALLPLLVAAQDRTLYWTGQHGRWDDAANWSLTPDGPGGAGVPRNSDGVVVAPGVPVTITIEGVNWCGALRIAPKRNGAVHVEGDASAVLNLTGGWTMKGHVDWQLQGRARMMVRRGVADVDVGGVLLESDVVIDGGGGWNLLSDLKLAASHDLLVRQGTLVTNGNHIVTGDLRFGGNGRKLVLAGGSAIEVSGVLDEGGVRGVVDPGSSHLLVQGVDTDWGALALRPAEALRGISVCGTGAGQTPFTINAQVITNYNGFNVSCNGVCDATVTVTVNGGVGPFAYSWATGPNTQTWTGICVGNKLVIVTDLGQNIGCAATVQVLGPPPLGVIFFPPITPPSCAQVCDGTGSALAVGGTGGGYAFSWNNGAGTGSSFNQLCAGVNTLEITDQNNCVFDTTFTTPLLPVSPVLTVSNADCSGACNGTASVVTTGGTGSFSYLWTPPPPQGQGTASVSGLCAGNWSVLVTDANGCDTALTFQVTEPPPIVPNGSQVNASCATACDGSATVAPTGATGPFTYLWTPAPGGGQGTANATGLCVGNWSVLITDQATGCDTLVQFAITGPPPLDVASTVTDATCAASCDGEVVLTTSGGTGPYTYAWTPAPPVGQGTATASLLCAGAWTVLVTDAVGCDTSITFTITAPPPIQANGTSTPISCPGACDGTATATATGGSGGFQYQWTPNPPVGQGTPTAEQLCPGDWFLTITDAAGCDTTVVFTFVDPPALQQTSSQTDVSCANACDGTASVVVSGGTPGYTYGWTPAPGGGQGTANATGLCAGAYSVLVTDASGCTLTVPFTIASPAPLQPSLQVVDASCPDACDGTAGVIVTGGTAPYTYAWGPAPGGGQGTPNATGLCPGVYQLTIADAAGCDTTLAYTIAAPAPIAPNGAVTDATCADGCDGSVVLAPTGGTGTYTYLWNPVPGNGQGAAQALGLCPGTVQVTITSGACDTTVTFTINAPPPLDAALSVTDATCWNSCDGEATATVSGGTPGYGYTWTPAPGAGQGTPAATGLCPGALTLSVVDAAGCDTTFAFNVNAPAPITPGLLVQNAGCSGSCDGTASVQPTGGTGPYTYVWSPTPGGGQGTPNATGLCAGNWSLLIDDAAGCDTTVQFTILAPSPFQLSLQVLDASCSDVCDGSAGVIVTGGTAPFTYTWDPAPGAGQGTANASGLCAGPYLLTVTDATNCDTTIAFTVGAPPPITAPATVTNASCASACDGSVVLVASGGNGTFTYTWSPVPSNGQGTAQASGLCPGPVQVTIGSGGCDTTLTFTIASPPALNVELQLTANTCAASCDGSATANVTGGTGGYTYVWSPAPGGGQGTPNATDLCAGAWTLTVSDAAGCDTTVAFSITAPPPIQAGLTVTQATCGGGCDGSADVQPSGGTPGYTIQWTPPPGGGQGTPTATDLCSGLYFVTITDGAGCDTTLQFTISTPAGITVNTTVTPASCADACDGAVDLQAQGGVPPYIFTWAPTPGAGQGTPSAGGMCAGDYTVTIADQAGCDTVFVVNVPAPTPIVPNGVSTNENCNGPCTGTASVAPTGGVGPYSFVWSPAPGAGQGTPNATGLCAGTWSCTITDFSGCDTVVTFTVLPQQPIDPGLTFADATCYDICNGTASVNPSGGAGGFTYLWTPTPPTGQFTPAVSDLCLGFWTVTVTDSVGCDTTVSFIIVKPPPVEANLIVAPENCNGPCTGEAQVFPTGGTPGYEVLWQPVPGGGQGTNQATALCAGQYTVTLTDLNGCDTTVAFTVDPVTPLSPNISSTGGSCPGACDGTVTVGPTGGVAPYAYFWSPPPGGGQGTPQATGLCAGVYSVTVTDAALCDSTFTVLVTSPAPLDVAGTVQDETCAGLCDGAIAVVVSGGTGAYTYAWVPAPPQGQGTANVAGLCPGSWSVTVADANGCDTTITFTVTGPSVLTNNVSVVPSQCQQCVGAITMSTTGGTAPYTYVWGAPLNLVTTDSLLTGLCAGVYTATISDNAGCTLNATVAVTDSNGETITVSDGLTSCPNTCDGTVAVAYTCGVPACSVQWYDDLGTLLSTADTLTGLCAGSYFVGVTNGDGCLTIDTALVTTPTPVTAGLSSTPLSCAGVCDGTATIGLSGGQAPYVITWSPAPGGGQGTPLATGLCDGPYDVLVQDAGGCDTTFSVLILSPTPLQPNASVTPVTCAGQCDAAITLAPSGGTGAYTYSWSPVPLNGQGSAQATGLCPGTWTVVLADANGCDTTLVFTVPDPQPLVPAVSVTQSQCQLCNGTASVVVTGGVAPYQITWSDAGGNVIGSGPAVAGLCAGFYTVSVVDASGCSVQASAAVSDSDGEVLTPIDGNTLCANGCDGTVAVQFTCAIGPCAVQWTDDQGNVIGVNVLTVGNLCAGDYFVQVTNADGCVSIDTATVAPSTVIIPNLSSTPETCPGACDGTATTGPVGGVAPYTYTWAPAPPSGQGTPQTTGLCGGVIAVTITDQSGCDTTATVLILSPQPITVAASVQDLSCSAACDGRIDLIAQGGTGALTYQWTPAPPVGQGTATADSLCAGSWSVLISDANGCDTTLTFLVVEPLPLTVATGATQSACGQCIGTAVATPSGGTAPYVYAWSQGGSLFATDSLAAGLCAGIYTVEVTDANGCSITATVPVTDVDGELLTTTNGLTGCPGDCNGVVSVAFQCGAPACSVIWTDANAVDLNEPGNVLDSLCAGTYFVQVTNGNGCVSIDTAFVTEPDPIVANLSTTPETCAGVCDGTATVGPTGGAGGYTYTWDPVPPAGQGTPQATGLCAGPWTVTITDTAGCSIVVPVLITGPAALAISAAIDPITCAGACDGGIDVTVQGGTAPYVLTWSPTPPIGLGTAQIDSLCAGDWTVLVTDVNGCDTSATFTLVDPPALLVALTSTDNTCFGDCLGTAAAVVNGGVPPYTLQWTSDGGTVIAIDTLDIGGLCAGNYALTVTDANGCVSSTVFTIGQGAPIDAGLVFTNETCQGPCDGTATVSPVGGAGGFTFLWQPQPGGGQGTPNATGLCPGNWSVTIADSLGCDTTVSFTILPFTPILPNASVQQVACNGACDGEVSLAPTGGLGGYTYAWTPVPPNGQGNAAATGLCPGTWSVTVTDAAGCDTNVAFLITEPPALVVALDTVVDASCATAADGSIAVTIAGGTPGYAIQWTGPGFSSTQEDIAGIVPGDYTIIVIDANGCTASLQVTVGALVSVVADAGPDVVACSQITVTLDGSGSQGATTYQWTDGQGNVVGTQPQLDLGTPAGGPYIYVLTVSDGPCTDTDTVLVTVDPTIADAGADQTFIGEDVVQLVGSSTGPVGTTFSWQPDSLLNDPTLANPVATLDASTWFVLTVVSPNGCTDVDSVLISVVPDIEITSGFTPNGDGWNDTWQIDLIDLFPECEVEIYNRWGELLFRSVGYGTPWDGRYNGGFVPVGTYYYVIELNDPKFPEPYTGPLTVIR